MDKRAKINALTQLGLFFKDSLVYYRNATIEDTVIDKDLVIQLAESIDVIKHENAWFTSESIIKSIEAWAKALSEDKVEDWLNRYNWTTNTRERVGVIMAGNIPMVGLHDAICVILCDHYLIAKLSTKDNRIMHIVLRKLQSLFGEEKISLSEQLKGVDTLIATGSDNSARYFEYYFRDKKRLIRKNRTSIAVLDGSESKEELEGLSEDIFTHFGLGCRNVTKLYLPNKYDLDKLFNAFYKYKEIINHNKYANNYDYNKAVYLMNKIELIENGFILLKEDNKIHSPVGVLFYEYYNEIAEVKENLHELEDSIQCVVSNISFDSKVAFGKAQSPDLWDYADGIDTIAFLKDQGSNS